MQPSANSAPASTQATRPASRPSRRPPATAPTTQELATFARLGKRNVGVHDPSTIVREGDWYYSFVTGNGVGVIRSKDLIAWSPMPKVFERSPAWVAEAVPGNRGHFWAPDIVRGKDGRWLLYYSVSTFGKNTSVMALASNATLDANSPQYSWRDEGIVVRSGAGDHFNAIDPAVTYDADGRLWMSFGSFWDGLRLVELDATTGLRKGDAAPIPIARNPEIEAPFIYRHGEHYYLFVNWGFCCRGIASTYEIRVGRADAISGPYLDRDGRELARGGGTLLAKSEGPMIGPGHAGIFVDRDGSEQFSFHFYDRPSGGTPMLGIRPVTWDAQGWPVLGEVK
jgi:arabinan endo-1,5-alpha-L-arabinosidase